ncbi:MAG: DUF4838 domain-containing protein [Acidobacteria bacterium]|nr:DUF4838 domain-containing protein [Acidobacteriota bacterium]
MRAKTILLAFLVAGTVAAAHLTLAENGRSAYSIRVARDASPSEKRAAAELQRFLGEMSGARLPIVDDTAKSKGRSILIGRGGGKIPFESLGPEGFVLKTVGRNLVIAGGRERGTMYGVYTFLDRLGCRWFTPQVSRIPKRASITIDPMNETQRPAFEYREVFFTEAWDKDWSARNRLNGQSHHLDESTGGRIRYYPFVHSFNQMIPPAKYFREHPEYFSLIDGQRRAERSQLCLTNPDVLRLGVEAVREWIRQHPEATIFSVSQNDWTGWCECDRCRRVEEEEGGVHSGPLIRFVNSLAEEIEKTHPGKLIDTLAYWYTERPPKLTRPRPNVRIRLCPIGACQAHPYEQCPYNRLFVDILKEWSKQTDRLYVWHYNTNFSHYLLPFPDFDELAADIPMYRRNGVVGLFLEGAYAPGGGGENAELRSYVMARLLWNPAAEVNREIDDFLEACYGPAAKPMRAYFDLLHEQVRGKNNHLWIFVQPRVPYLSREFLDRAAALFRQAEAAAGNDAIRRRIEKARLSIEYVELNRAKQFRIQGGSYEPGGIDSLKRRFADLIASAKRFGIQQLHEGRAIAEDQAEFDSRIRAYPVVSIENAKLRVTVAANLNARIVEIIDQPSGLNLLRVPDAASPGYPNLSGAWVSVMPEYRGRAYPVTWEQPAQPGAKEVTLSGAGPDGLKLRRRIWLAGEEAFVRTATSVENTGAAGVRVAVQARAEYSPRDELDGRGLALRYRAMDGAAADLTLFQPGQETTGNATLIGSKRPAGTWEAYHRSGVPGLVNLFRADQAERCVMDWSLRGASLITLTLWSKEATLKPGETIELDAGYGVAPR